MAYRYIKPHKNTSDIYVLGIFIYIYVAYEYIKKIMEKIKVNTKNVESAEFRRTAFVNAANPNLNPFVPTVPTLAVRDTASLGIMGAPRVPPLNPSETIVF